jgi:hypothetical protein
MYFRFFDKTVLAVRETAKQAKEAFILRNCMLVLHPFREILRETVAKYRSCG